MLYPRGHCCRIPKVSILTQTQAVEGDCLGKKARTYVSLILKQSEMRVVTSWGKEGIDWRKKNQKNNQGGTFRSAGREPNFSLGGVTQTRHPLNCML